MWQFGAVQTVLRVVYPPTCLLCRDIVDSDHGLCGPCWRETHFIGGLVCDSCGTPLPGSDTAEIAHCDDCLTIARPWAQGRAALLYSGNGRKLVLALKHGDRTDIATPAARWLAQVARPLVRPGAVVVPVPLHWWRYFQRRYNQAAVLAQPLARHLGLGYCPDALRRTRATTVLEGQGRDQRFQTLAGAIAPSRHGPKMLAGRPVLLVDDVLTSGATLAAATEACFAAGATDVCVLALARVAKRP